MPVDFPQIAFFKLFYLPVHQHFGKSVAENNLR